MANLFSNPAGQRLLEYLREIFEEKPVYFRKHPLIIFVCGGRLEDDHASLRKQFINWAESNLTDFNCVLAETALKYDLSNGEPYFRNLAKFETVVAQVADCVLIFPESAGSFAETGFFANSEKISRKTLVVNPLTLQSEDSFLNLGPLATFNHVSFLQPTILLDGQETIDFTQLAQRLGRVTRQRERLRHQRFGKFKVKQKLLVVFALLRFLRLADIENLRHAIITCFGGNPPYRELEFLLRILLAAKFVQQNERYFQAVAGVNLVEIENLEMETVFARVTLFYEDNATELFDALSELNQ
jgi:hypothetical protein